MSALTRWLAAALIALLLASSYLLDGSPSDIDTTRAVAADVQDAIHAAQQVAAK